MTLQLTLQIVLVIINDTLIGNWNEDLFSLSVRKVVNSIINVIVEAQSPFEFKCTGFA